MQTIMFLHGDSDFGEWDDPDEYRQDAEQASARINPRYCPRCDFPYDRNGNCDCSRWSWEPEAR